MRSQINPHGHEAHPSVAAANECVSKTLCCNSNSDPDRTLHDKDAPIECTCCQPKDDSLAPLGVGTELLLPG